MFRPKWLLFVMDIATQDSVLFLLLFLTSNSFSYVDPSADFGIYKFVTNK